MSDQLSEEEAQALLKELNDLIETGPWEKSNFLRVIGKNISDMRDKVASKVGGLSKTQIKAEATTARQTALRSTQQEIFVSLYSAKGSDMSTWERIVTSLPRQMISRPIYALEEDVKTLIKHKENTMNEAYVAIYVNPSDILVLSTDKTLKDKFGKELLNLKDRSLLLDNISRFVHTTGVYQLDRGRLIKQ